MNFPQSYYRILIGKTRPLLALTVTIGAVAKNILYLICDSNKIQKLLLDKIPDAINAIRELSITKFKFHLSEHEKLITQQIQPNRKLTETN